MFDNEMSREARYNRASSLFRRFDRSGLDQRRPGILAMSTIGLLYLLHLSDSALPIGSAAHSFGLETLTSMGWLTPSQLQDFLSHYVMEAGALEASCCRRGYDLGARPTGDAQHEARLADEWVALNHELSALKLARESRQASLKLGNRLLHLACDLTQDAQLRTCLGAWEANDAGAHHACTYGLIGARLGLDVASVVAAFLRQMFAGLVAACQKLTPLGQHQAAAIQWALYAQIDAVAASAAHTGPPGVPSCFTPLVEVASMRHPALGVRLFVS